MLCITRLLSSLCLSCVLLACGNAGTTSTADASATGGDTKASPTGDAAGKPDGLAGGPEALVADAVVVERDTAHLPSPDLAAATPDATQKDVATPDAARPEAADVTRPDVSTPEATSPDVATSDVHPGKPDGPSADTAMPEAPTAACSQALFTHLSPAELKTLLDGGEDPVLINVKGTSIENIPGTDVVLANDVAGIESFVKRDLCANIVLYCRTGATSQSVGSELIARGYTHVRDLAGGITAWKAAGYPTE